MRYSRHSSNYSKTAKHGGYAHFPGTGPSPSTCSTCGYAKREGHTKTFCRKATELTGHNRGSINPFSPACKYYTKQVQNN